MVRVVRVSIFLKFLGCLHLAAAHEPPFSSNSAGDYAHTLVPSRERVKVWHGRAFPLETSTALVEPPGSEEQVDAGHHCLTSLECCLNNSDPAGPWAPATSRREVVDQGARAHDLETPRNSSGTRRECATNHCAKQEPCSDEAETEDGIFLRDGTGTSRLRGNRETVLATIGSFVCAIVILAILHLKPVCNKKIDVSMPVHDGGDHGSAGEGQEPGPRDADAHHARLEPSRPPPNLSRAHAHTLSGALPERHALPSAQGSQITMTELNEQDAIKHMRDQRNTRHEHQVESPSGGGISCVGGQIAFEPGIGTQCVAVEDRPNAFERCAGTQCCSEKTHSPEVKHPSDSSMHYKDGASLRRGSVPPSLELVFDQNNGANGIGADYEDPSDMLAETDDSGCAWQDTARTQGDRMDTETESSQPGSEIQETQIYDAAPVYGEGMDTKREDTETESEIQETHFACAPPPHTPPAEHYEQVYAGSAFGHDMACRGEPLGPGNKRPREDEGYEGEAQHSENTPRQVKVPR